jgi:hypothetical protein
MKCGICEQRTARRFCPALSKEICAPCCGTEREETISCPFTCEYLREARRHEKPPEIDSKTLPNQDLEVSEDFLRDHEAMLTYLGTAILTASLETEGAVDSDAREAIEGLIRTYRTLLSGLYFESRPDNPIARSIFDGIRYALADAQKKLSDAGQRVFRDVEILTMLAFYERVYLGYYNGRSKGRAFLDFLRTKLPGTRARSELSTSGGSLIVTP